MKLGILRHGWLCSGPIYIKRTSTINIRQKDLTKEIKIYNSNLGIETRCLQKGVNEQRIVFIASIYFTPQVGNNWPFWACRCLRDRWPFIIITFIIYIVIANWLQIKVTHVILKTYACLLVTPSICYVTQQPLTYQCRDIELNIDGSCVIDN